ncbi:hypothetical protein M0R45_035478 [Rubus argutus]|uniref:Uncharacterized protein n=1 Tax=Rubus argutus TaxID=59490 RepID=A0AAW1VU60_RUBAR
MHLQLTIATYASSQTCKLQQIQSHQSSSQTDAAVCIHGARAPLSLSRRRHQLLLPILAAAAQSSIQPWPCSFPDHREAVLDPTAQAVQVSSVDALPWTSSSPLQANNQPVLCSTPVPAGAPLTIDRSLSARKKKKRIIN